MGTEMEEELRGWEQDKSRMQKSKPRKGSRIQIVGQLKYQAAGRQAQGRTEQTGVSG